VIPVITIPYLTKATQMSLAHSRRHAE